MLVESERSDQVVDFVSTINRYDYDADIKYGSHMVDARPILGVLYLAVFRTVEPVLHTEESNCRGLKQRLVKFAVQDQADGPASREQAGMGIKV